MDTADLFRDRHDRAAAERDALTARASRTANLRLGVFGLGIAALVWAELRPEWSAVALVVTALIALVFVGLIIHHSRLTQAQRRAAELAAVNGEALARLARDWDGLPVVPEHGPPTHPYAHDLDIFGHGSLARYLATTGTTVGRERLWSWLLTPAERDEVLTRQAAVRELVPELEFRQDLQVSGRLTGDPEPETLEAFLEWAESEPWLLRRPWLVWTTRLLPLATLVFVVLQLEGTLARPWWILTLVVGAVLAGLYGRRAHALMAGASLGDASVRHYAGLVGRVQEAEFQAAALRDIRAVLSRDCDAGEELEKLGWLTELAELRHGGLFYVLIHLPTLWDFHVLTALERWQVRAGRHAREWIDALAGIDALCALAGPAHDEAGWSFPEVVGGESRGDGAAGEATAQPADREAAASPQAPDDDPRCCFQARGLAHPLLTPQERVANDVRVGPPGSFLMVTGSNMSGKSTLLRAIGVNAVLAEAGGPVCAEHLSLPPLDLRTSMRVDDSLERGVSLFMAELQQLKRVVDAADALQETGGAGAPAESREEAGAPSRVLLYLLDEILHGTNSAERQVAVREVLAHLIECPAIGAISTHDLTLAEAEPLASAVAPVHFRETVHPEGYEPPMTFDYTLRDGVATSTNALKLVRLVGLTGG